MKTNTLTLRLFYRLAPTILSAVLAITVLAFFSARREIDQKYDAQLIGNANVLWILIEDELNEQNDFDEKKLSFDYDESQVKENTDVDDYAEGRMFRIWKSGHIVMLSDNALPEKVPPARPGFSNVYWHSKKWRLFSLAVPHAPVTIEVGEKISLRNKFLGDVLADLALPMAVLVPVIALLLWAGIGNGLRTLPLLVQQLRQRSPDDLSPVTVKALPSDLEPLVSSLNTLLEKLGLSLSAERRFADHAAHQLRTPLAGLKLQLQMLKRADEDERPDLVDDLTASVERATTLVGQLLTAARVSHQPLQLRTVNVYDALAAVIAGLGHVIASKLIDASLEGDETALIETDEVLLTIILANIIENAVKFTSAGGVIRASVSVGNKVCQVTVEDTGPGIPASQREHVFRKFSRLDQSDEEGTGLGLAIVAEAAERLRGKIALSDTPDGVGLKVILTLPNDSSDFSFASY